MREKNKRKKIIVANWKMNPVTLKEARALFLSIKKETKKLHRVETIICPPFLYLIELSKISQRGRLVLGAQDSFWKEDGPYTGEISPLMLSQIGVGAVILGHSERRSQGEDDRVVNCKVKTALKRGLRVILCVGENKRDEDGKYFSFIADEIKASLVGVSRRFVKQLIIAYEPIWAVGPKATQVDTPEDTVEMVIFIRKILNELFGKSIAMEMPILYGGSSNPKNAEGFLRDGGVSGLLVGRASRDSKKFKDILEIANQVESP